MKASHAKYGKFAYSSSFAYSVPTGGYTLEQYALDSTLGLSDDEGETWKTRRISTESGIVHLGTEKEAVLKSTWSPYKDVTIETYLLPPKAETPNWYVRAHKITAGRYLQLAEGGWAISNVRKSDKRALREYDTKINEGTSPKIMGNYDLSASGTRNSRRIGTYAVSKGASGIVDLLESEERGWKEGDGVGGGEGYAMIVNADPNTNLVEKKTVIPTLMGEIKAGEERWYVSGVFGRPEGPKIQNETFLDGWDKRPEIPKWLAELIHA